MDLKYIMQKYIKKLHNQDDVGSKIIQKEKKVGFLYLKSMTDPEIFSISIIEPINKTKEEISLSNLQNSIIHYNNIIEINSDEVIKKILKGSVVVFVENESKMLAIDIRKFPERSPSEPPTSSVIQGPREGFVEDIKTNITLLRRRFYSENFIIKNMFVGKYSDTQISICYIKDVADKNVIIEIEKKLKSIKIDGIIDSYYVAQFLQDRKHSLFKQVGSIEKPDIVASKILEGRVAIIVDNSPIVLTLPYILIEDLQNSNDYYTNHIYASFIRFIRLLGVIISVFSPAVFLSFRLYHYNALPLNYEITIADTTQHIPFTPFVEVLFVTFLFQILYEVSLRLPQYLGLATSIVGALILGDTGVRAGLISPPAVIVVALAKISLYTVPEQAAQINVLQIVFIILGGSMGMLGVFAGNFYILNYLCSIDSYGAPYLAPYAPRVQNDLKDGFIKEPLTCMTTRPKSFSNENEIRQKN